MGRPFDYAQGERGWPGLGQLYEILVPFIGHGD